MPGALQYFNILYSNSHNYCILQRGLGYEPVCFDSGACSNSCPKLNLEKYAVTNKCMISDLKW